MRLPLEVQAALICATNHLFEKVSHATNTTSNIPPMSPFFNTFLKLRGIDSNII
jgi:hypothetical protein